jgi:fructokinase
MRVYDVNLRPPWYDHGTIERSLDQCTVVKLNEDEALRLANLFGLVVSDAAGCATHLLSRFNIELACITRGPNGCILVTGKDCIEDPGSYVKVADAVGAGDAFTAALICGLLGQWPLAVVARFANGVGGLVASRKGAMPALAAEYHALRERICS